MSTDKPLSASVEELGPSLPLPRQPEAEDKDIASWKEEVVKMQHHTVEFLGRNFLPYISSTINIDDLMQALEILLYWGKEQWNGTDHVFVSYDTTKISNTITGVMSHNKVTVKPVLIFVRTKHGDKLIFVVFGISYSEIVQDPLGLQYIFIDHSSRKYKDWAEFLNNNQLPEGIFCFPQGGKYDLPLHLHVSEKLPTRRKMDVIMSMLGMLSTMLTVVKILKFFPFCPYLTIVCYAIDGIVAFYFMYRGLEELIDRHSNGQAITLKHKAARQCWLSVAVSILNVLTSAGSLSLHTVTAAGRQVSVLGARLVQGLEVSCEVVKGIKFADWITTNQFICKIGLFLKKVIFRWKRFICIACRGAHKLLKMNKKN